MIREFIEYWLTPVPRAARRLGYLYESIAISGRYRRCRTHWQAHLDKCHHHARTGAGSARRILVLGSGPLLEIPMDEWIAEGRELILADFVHPRAVRRKWRGHRQVELLTVDLLGVAEPLASGKIRPAPRPPELTAWKPDFVLSANCLSQLPHRPLAQGDSEDAAYATELSRAHLEHVRAFRCPHLIIADFETRVRAQGKIVEFNHPFYDRGALRMLDSWSWNLAPIGEIYSDRAVEMSVGAFTLS